jgi:hypothetical protein
VTWRCCIAGNPEASEAVSGVAAGFSPCTRQSKIDSIILLSKLDGLLQKQLIREITYTHFFELFDNADATPISIQPSALVISLKANNGFKTRSRAAELALRRRHLCAQPYSLFSICAASNCSASNIHSSRKAGQNYTVRPYELQCLSIFASILLR